MSFCPSDCANNTLVQNPPAGCDLPVRKGGIDRIGFYSCGIDLPTPWNCPAIEALLDSNVVAISGQLRNVAFADPVTEELVVADCRPTTSFVTERVMTFEDVVIATKANTSPLFGEDKFADYDFWSDKKSKKFTLRYFFIFCDGSVRIPRDADGNPMEGTFDMFLSFERQGTANAAYTLEIKKGIIKFKGDPLDFVKPELNHLGEVFDINTCEL